ncbi:MAG: glutamyl-tRNA reductase [Armatimonadetes bacterium]|nr:glutamyl-tRNA reductase [Armatimonadota bacterium]
MCACGSGLAMRLLAAGVSHKSAPVEIRERLALPSQRQVDALQDLVSLPDVAEALVLSTCNRFELYVAESPCSTGLGADQLVSRITGVPLTDLRPHLYAHEDESAARHLSEVASGADSMVLGECEIMGQVKEAADLARGAGTLGMMLTRLTDTALQAGKRARRETTIDQGCASVASVGVSLARQICGDPRRTTALLIGAGETAEFTLQRLMDGGTERVFIANRTPGRATILAETYGGHAVAFEGIYEAMVEADVVIASTSAPHAVVHAEPMRQIVRRRGARPLFMIDLAVPRDIEPEAGDLDNVFVYNIDSLQEAVEEALRGRESQLPRVREICAEAARSFQTWAASLDLLPTLLELRERVEAIRLREYEQALRDMGQLNARQQKQLHLMTKRLVQGLIDAPLSRLRSKACDGDGLAYLAAMRELFGLQSCPPAPLPPEGDNGVGEPVEEGGA